MAKKKMTTENEMDAPNMMDVSEENEMIAGKEDGTEQNFETAPDMLDGENPEEEDEGLSEFLALGPGEPVTEDPNGYDPDREGFGEESPVFGEEPRAPEGALTVPPDDVSSEAEVHLNLASGAAGLPPAEETDAVEDAPAQTGKAQEDDSAPSSRRAARQSRKNAESEDAAKPLTEQQKFYALDFNALDRGLTAEQRQEWNAIYASYRGHSVMTGTIVGIDKHAISQRNRTTGEMKRQEMYCAVVVPYRVRIMIPATEMWMKGEERPDFVLRNMIGASIDFVVMHVDREAEFAIASRRLAMRARRYYFNTQRGMQKQGSHTQCHVLAVGPRRCLVECWGHDLDLTQREMRYTAIPDLRSEYRPGNELECVVKGYDAQLNHLSISVKEVEPNPFDGAELRHPVGSRRSAVIAGKYAGGVFCNLPDGVVVMCSYSFHYEDAEFAVGDHVIVMIRQYEFAKKQIFGKIVAKW
ncbi:hypothetical protein [Dysosmobacter sp.]